MQLTKVEVAARQLDTAIKLLFNASDVVSVHTLAAASATVFADILENKKEISWRDKIIQRHTNLEKREVLKILKEAQNFFKHADRDPDDTFDFPEQNNDEMIMIATFEYGLLLTSTKLESGINQKLSNTMSVFQIWNIATKPDIYRLPKEYMDAADRIFPNIVGCPRFEQLSRGSLALKKWKSYRHT